MHSFITGRSGSGKTFLAMEKARQLRAHGMPVIVLNPIPHNEWSADFETAEPAEFIRVVRANRGCHCFVDEAAIMVGLHPSEDMMWTALVSRNLGHRFYYISPRVMTVARSVRDQCSEHYVFRIGYKDAKELAESEGEDAIKAAARLPRYEYLWVRPFKPVERCKLRI